MSVKFKRSKKIAPGVKLNLNKKSASVTFGGKYGRITTGTSGRVTTSASIPGTGIYASHSSGGHTSTKSKEHSEAFDDVIRAEDLSKLSTSAFHKYASDFSAAYDVSDLDTLSEDQRAALTDQMIEIEKEKQRRAKAVKNLDKKLSSAFKWPLGILAVVGAGVMFWACATGEFAIAGIAGGIAAAMGVLFELLRN